MSSSTASAAGTSTAVAVPSATNLATAGGLLLSMNRNAQAAIMPMPTITAQFREIHKNTWLKRLSAEGKKITVGPKKSEKSWVVFCVHDDTDAVLEGYADPRQVPSHAPEWLISMQDTLHISHALIPNSHEFEFVVTLSNEVVRFHAMSWEIMQEWVETLRCKLREMKILSPRENLYTKLPEIRAPLLPTRDPTSPLPAPPPVPAAIVPGVERIASSSIHMQQVVTTEANTNNENASTSSSARTNLTGTSEVTSINLPASISSGHSESKATFNNASNSTNSNLESPATTSSLASVTSTSASTTSTSTSAPCLFTSMSNTLSQNLLNMLSDPISAYSEQLHNDTSSISSNDMDDEFLIRSSPENSLLSNSLKDLTTNRNSIIRESVGVGGINCCPSNSVRLDVLQAHRISADSIKKFDAVINGERDNITRLQSTTNSINSGTSSMHSNNNNITELKVVNEFSKPPPSASSSKYNASSAGMNNRKTNVTIIQVSNERNEKLATASNNNHTDNHPQLPQKTIIAEVFKFPEISKSATNSSNKSKHHEYKSNVQIIPSNSNSSNSSTIKVLAQEENPSTIFTAVGTKTDQHNYSNNATKKPLNTNTPSTLNNSNLDEQNQQISTKVHIGSTEASVYGTCFTPQQPSSASSSKTSTPKMSKKIILSANTSGVTKIAVNNVNDTSSNIGSSTLCNEDENKAIAACRNNAGHYEKVFLSSTISTKGDMINEDGGAIACSNSVIQMADGNCINGRTDSIHNVGNNSSPTPKVTVRNLEELKQKTKQQGHLGNRVMTATPSTLIPIETHSTVVPEHSPITTRRVVASPQQLSASSNNCIQRPPPVKTPFVLTRGLTEAVITSRPSRKDFLSSNNSSANKKSSSKATQASANNNSDGPGSSNATVKLHSNVNRTISDCLGHRKRSSSTSDAHSQLNCRTSNNNEMPQRQGVANNMPTRQPSQHHVRIFDGGLNNVTNTANTTNVTPTACSKRISLREQQIMQLRREIMHPGGVRLQLRRKDCINSIAWVEALGAVWVAGWKQKEHPVLYNALHIGDQLLSIAGVTISSPAEANKIIRNANTLFVELLIRRIPFGRGYAIRREREGQCLGLIRDGNTATVVDVVPNSLAARHGLPPKTQSADGTTLTFWVLTEINGRPLNLFFKDNEIRDRLNSVGRDISILVQPSDLITKLKKQLKSLRSYKDYLVQ